MTYTLFTLFPILLFALVTLWKLKLNYDTDIYQLQTRLTKVTNRLNCESLIWKNATKMLEPLLGFIM